MIATRQLGRTSLRLPELGLGGAPLGDLVVVLDDLQADAVLSAAWEAGIRYVDTAPWYGRGQSEHRIGRDLRRRPRQDFVLSTKVGRVLRRRVDRTQPQADIWAGGLQFEIEFDYGYDAIMRSYEDSLQRLGFDSIDMLVIHDLDLPYHKTDARLRAHLDRLTTSGWRALDQLKRGGHVKAIGAGINALGHIPLFIDTVALDFFLVALPYTLLEHKRFLAEEMPLLTARGIGLIIGAVFSSGIGATGAVPDARFNYEPAGADILAHVRAIEAVCADHDVPLAAASLAFPLRHPAVASIIPGALTPEQVQSNVALYARPIPEALWTDLVDRHLVARDGAFPTPA
jgi:D-threo-aldose 1-dehydrogenase